MRNLLLALLFSVVLQANDRHVMLNASGTQFASDKQMHFIWGYAFGNIGFCIAKDQGWQHPERYGILLAFLAGLLKESMDYRAAHGIFDCTDLAYTVTGGSVTTLYSVRW